MDSKRIARLTRDSFLSKPLFTRFTDIRKRPRISLQTILTSLFVMPFFGIKSLLSNDRIARSNQYKRLFGTKRKMVASDSTFARVLRWLKIEESRQFLLQFVAQFEEHQMLRKALSPTGPLRRIGILDGSHMGGHWHVTLCLAGMINYPVMVRRSSGRGEEQKVARKMMVEASRLLGDCRPDLWLLDALYFNVPTIETAQAQGAQVLFKVREPEFRTVTSDAKNLVRQLRGRGDRKRLGSTASVQLADLEGHR